MALVVAPPCGQIEVALHWLAPGYDAFMDQVCSVTSSRFLLFFEQYTRCQAHRFLDNDNKI